MRRRHQRLDFAGTVLFITTVTRERGSWFSSDKTCTGILTIFEHYRTILDIDCLGFVLMPDHLHALLYQKMDGPKIPSFMNSFKRETSKSLEISGFSGPTLWRDTYDDVALPNQEAIRTRLEYMHWNPVRRGLVEDQLEYPWSSARFYFELDGQKIMTIVRPW